MSGRPPLFVRWANGKVSEMDIARSLLELTRSDETKEIIGDAISSGLPDLSQFREDFQYMLTDLIESGGPGPRGSPIRQYMNDYTSCSIEDHPERDGRGRGGSEDNWLSIKEAGSPWLEGVVCYNLLMFLYVGRLEDLKKCPVCNTFFEHKGKHAKYCSESCKGRKAG